MVPAPARDACAVSPAEPSQPPASASRGWPVFLLAYLAYGSITTLAMLAGTGGSPAKALLAGALNALPEALAGPWVWRAAARRSPTRAWLLGVGLAFATWAMLASTLVFSLWQAAERGSFNFRLQAEVAVWRFAMGALVFTALVAVATAGRRGREAAEAMRLAERAEAVRARAELATLRSQLNPHFLLNVLHSLIGIVHRDPQRAEAMIERLGDLLRDALELHAQGLDEVPLERELALTRGYLEIERLRLGERLAVEWQVEAQDRARPVPPFSLQGLVENAVRHSIAPRASGGTITITVEDTSTGLAVTVDDDGGATTAVDGGRRGLELLRERLRLLHGAGARLEAGPHPGGGFRARFLIPRGPA